MALPGVATLIHSENILSSLLLTGLLSHLCRMSLSPRWRDFNHFDEFMSVRFNDGQKHEDLCKVRVLLFRGKTIQYILAINLRRSFSNALPKRSKRISSTQGL